MLFRKCLFNRKQKKTSPANQFYLNGTEINIQDASAL